MFKEYPDAPHQSSQLTLLNFSFNILCVSNADLVLVLYISASSLVGVKEQAYIHVVLNRA